MSTGERGRVMSIGSTPKPRQALYGPVLLALVLCALCLQPLYGCASKPGDEGAVDQAIKYSTSRTILDMAVSSVFEQTPDAELEVSLMSLERTPEGDKEMQLEPSIVSDTMASWGPNEWAANRDDLYFNFAAHFRLICKQAHEYGDVPEGYTVTCPDYMVVYDSQKSTGFIVTSDGVYRKTDDPDNPIGEAIVLVNQS